MKIRRYLAKDMRLALHQVREQQGPDAVIMSSRTTSEGVEVVAAVDFDVEEAVAKATPATVATEETGTFSQLFREVGQREAARTDGVTDELNALRRMLETQLATLAWNDLTRRAPIHTEVLKELTTYGMAAEHAADIVSQLPARAQLHEAQRLALAIWAKRIPTQEERWMDRGGTVALIGPTGVGKTTTLAKLAARWVLRHGTRDIVLISADSVRIGAQDQVQSIGRLLGVPTLLIDRLDELPALLAQWEHRRLVLIDTAGFAPRDQQLAPTLASLSVASSRLETTLVLSTSAQTGTNQECLQRFRAAQPKSCILTKADEATSLGGVLSAVMQARLPIAYFCEGQQVGEDVRPVRAHHLVSRAVKLSRVAGAVADEDLLSRRFGGIAHALA